MNKLFLKHKSLAQPTLNVLRTPTLLTVEHNHLTQSVFYNKVLTISCHLWNTVLTVKATLLVYEEYNLYSKFKIHEHFICINWEEN